MQEANKGPEGWLLFIHQLPPKPDYFRVKVRRRLQRVGAVALKNSVYVLPNTSETMEDLQWLRRSVVDEGGEVTLCAASFVEGVSDREVEGMFRAQADAEYREIIEAARAHRTNPSEADLHRLTHQLAQAEGRDFFGAAGGPMAQRAVADVQSKLGGGPGATGAGATAAGATGAPAPRGGTWVTRENVFVDRMASAWLIRRFVDPGAVFRYVPAQGYQPHPGEVRFDMFDGEFTHVGDECTFEVLLSRFCAEDAALRAIAEIIHDIDCKDGKYGRADTAGVASVIRGITLTHPGDAARIEAGMGLFDGLYASFQPGPS